jgi:hypothetical protein
MNKTKTTCSKCGKVIYRRFKGKGVIVNRYGRFYPVCKTCQKIRKRKRAQEFRNLKITPSELRMLSKLNSYPSVVPDHLGTDGPTMNLKVIKYNNELRVKGAVWLENWSKKHRHVEEKTWENK